jgi:hypothetical protein
MFNTKNSMTLSLPSSMMAMMRFRKSQKTGVGARHEQEPQDDETCSETILGDSFNNTFGEADSVVSLPEDLTYASDSEDYTVSFNDDGIQDGRTTTSRGRLLRDAVLNVQKRELMLDSCNKMMQKEALSIFEDDEIIDSSYRDYENHLFEQFMAFKEQQKNTTLMSCSA